MASLLGLTRRNVPPRSTTRMRSSEVSKMRLIDGLIAAGSGLLRQGPGRSSSEAGMLSRLELDQVMPLYFAAC